MPKQTIAEKSVYWMKVISLGLILGISIQFAKAWTNPTSTPPGGNVSGPITTSGVGQYKTGKLGVNMSSVPVSYALQVNEDVGVGGSLYTSGNAYFNGYLGFLNLINCDLKTNGEGTVYCGTDASGGGGIASISGGSCQAGQVVQSISAGGTVSCIADAVGASAPPATQAAAWVSFKGDGSIYTSYNVSSVTRTSAGHFTINFAHNMSSANYATIFTTTNFGYSGNQTIGLDKTKIQTPGSVSLWTYLGDNTGKITWVDLDYNNVVVYSN